MSDQPGSREPSGRPGADRYGQGRDDGSRAGPSRPRPGTPGTDLFGDLQRWFIRQSAKSMRKELGGQVRRTLGGGKPEPADVWDTATTEIPPEVGEAPECQWCPVCRAARRMRDAGPGLGGQLSGAGDAVASAVQDAIGALDLLLSKAGGAPGGSREGGQPPTGPPPGGTGDAGPPSAGTGDVSPPSAGTGETGESEAATGQDPWSSPPSPAAADAEATGMTEENSDPAGPAESADGHGNGTDDRG